MASNSKIRQRQQDKAKKSQRWVNKFSRDVQGCFTGDKTLWVNRVTTPPRQPKAR